MLPQDSNNGEMTNHNAFGDQQQQQQNDQSEVQRIEIPELTEDEVKDIFEPFSRESVPRLLDQVLKHVFGLDDQSIGRIKQMGLRSSGESKIQSESKLTMGENSSLFQHLFRKMLTAAAQDTMGGQQQINPQQQPQMQQQEFSNRMEHINHLSDQLDMILEFDENSQHIEPIIEKILDEAAIVLELLGGTEQTGQGTEGGTAQNDVKARTAEQLRIRIASIQQRIEKMTAPLRKTLEMLSKQLQNLTGGQTPTINPNQIAAESVEGDVDEYACEAVFVDEDGNVVLEESDLENFVRIYGASSKQGLAEALIELDIKHLIIEGKFYCDKDRFDELRNRYDTNLSGLLVESVDVILEGAYTQYKLAGRTMKRQWRCTSGPKAGRIVAKASDCSKRNDLQKSRRMKRTQRIQGPSMRRKAERTKLTSAVSKRAAQLNKALSKAYKPKKPKGLG